MEQNKEPQRIYNRFGIRSVIGAVLILLIPLVAMQFSDEVDWSPVVFIVMGILLFGTGLATELTLRKFNNPAHRVITTIIILAILLLVWAELAVGVFGTPLAGL